MTNLEQGEPRFSRKSECIEGTEIISAKRLRIFKRIIHVAYRFDEKTPIEMNGELSKFGFDTTDVRSQYEKYGRVLLYSTNKELLINYIEGIGIGPVVTTANLKW